MTEREYSISPSGEKFQIPNEKESREEFEKLIKIVARQRQLDREIVVVVGVGFVGAVMAAVVADSTDENGASKKFDCNIHL